MGTRMKALSLGQENLPALSGFVTPHNSRAADCEPGSHVLQLPGGLRRGPTPTVSSEKVRHCAKSPQP